MPDDTDPYLAPLPTTDLAPSLRKVVRGGEKLKGVQPDLLTHWNALQGEFSKAGITPEIKSGYRTTAQQQALYNNPATRALTKGNDGITNISPHQEGRALDISFNGSQRAKGRQIIADYAQRNNLHVPGDEPWHIAIPRQGNQDPYLAPIVQSKTQAEPTQTVADDPYLAPLTQQPKTAAPLKSPQTTVTMGDGVDDVQPKLAPIKFTASEQSDNLNAMSRMVGDLVTRTQMQGMQLPANHPDLLGQHTEARFDHQPTAEEVDDAMMERLGKGYGAVAKRFRDEMGVPLTSSAIVEKQSDGSYIAHAKPTQGFIDAVNAYATGGRTAYENAISAQTTGKAAFARDTNAELKRGQGVAQDLGQAGVREVGRSAQFLQNAADIVRGRAPEDDANALAIARATAAIPQPSTWTGSAADMLAGTAGTINRAEALGGGGGFPASVGIESAQSGPEAAYKAGVMTAPILAAGPIARAVGADEMSGVGRQLTTRGVAGTAMAAPAALEGAPLLPSKDKSSVLGSFVGGAAFPTGERGAVERLTDLAIDRAPTVGVPGEATVNIDQRLADREAAVKPVTDAQGNVLLNPDEVAQGGKPKIKLANSPTPEPAHAANFRERAPDGTFTDGPAVYPNEFKPENVPQPVSEPNTLAQPATPTEPLGEVAQPRDAASTPSERTANETEPPQSDRVEIPKPVDTRSPSVVRDAESSATRPDTPESTTSARKAQLADDRAELDLPELPPADRKGWRTSLINAKEKGLDQKAERLADQILRNPRALDDEQTAGMVLRLQQLKNEHAGLLKAIEGETDPDKLAQHRADLESVEDSFDNISEAVKKSGTEKGRSLASQKLTINQDHDLVSMLNRYKAKVGKPPTPEIRAQIEAQQSRIADLEKQLAEKSTKGATDRIARDVRREGRARTRKVLDDEAATIKQNIAAEFARLKSQSAAGQFKSQGGLGALDPDGVITKNALKYARNRFEAGVTDASQLIDDVHGVLSEFLDGINKRQVAEMISGYGRQGVDKRSDLTKQLADLKTSMKRDLAAADVAAGTRTERMQGPRKSDAPLQGPKLTDAPKVGPRETKSTIQSRYQKQINEIERRIREQDFTPKAPRGPTVLDPETQKIQVNLERAKQDFQRQLRTWQAENRTKTEKVADLAVQWGRAAKLMYISTLGKLSSAATGRMVMSPLENLIGEIPHRLMPELSRKATTEGGGFDRAAEVAALWKSGRFRAMLDQVTKGGSDLDVLFGGQKSADKEMSSGGVLGVPGRIHGALKEYPRQAEFDRAFTKALKNYERNGKDISRPDVQLAAKMEAYNSAERARFQQRNVVSDTFNDAMAALERKGPLGKGLAKGGRFIFPITRVPVNVVGETLNYTFGIPRAIAETAIRGGVKNLTPEQANNIMRAYKKGGVGLAMMTYAFLNPQQFGGYYQKGDKRNEKDAQPGEVTFFGKRIPKVLTHVPILEAAQLAATARRVMDGLADKEGRVDSTIGGGIAAGKGLAEQIPFYETPARFFTGQEGSRGVAQLGGEQARGMIPGFVQEAAKATDTTNPITGKKVVRSPAGSFAERFAQGVELGVPGLRQRVPTNDRIEKMNTKQVLTDRARSGQQPDLDSLVDAGTITKADKKAIEREADLTPRQVAFNNAFPDQALARYERMSENQRMEMQDLMSKKAHTLLHSDSTPSEAKQRTFDPSGKGRTFQERIDALGIEPRDSRKRSNLTPSFQNRFSMGVHP